MKDDKAFSIIEIFMGLMITSSLDIAEFILDPLGLGFILMPAEIGVGVMTTGWFVYKGGSRIEARIIMWIMANAIGFIPMAGAIPMKRAATFALAAHLTNKAFERDAEEEKKLNKKGGGNEEEEEGEPEEDDYDDEEPEDEDENEEEELLLVA